MYKNGDLVFCEYAKGERAKGRIIGIKGNEATIEIAIAGRRCKTIEKDEIIVDIEKIFPFTFQ